MAFIEYLELIICISVGLIISLLMTLYIMQTNKIPTLPIISRHKEEQYFLDPVAIENVLFPSLEIPPTLDLSVIIPAYDEEKRLPSMLDECMDFLEEKAKGGKFTYEVIVVSDGSRDGTVALALKYSKRYTVEKFRVLELIENRGKGGAVRLGMLSARGRQLLFADADGATKFADYEKLSERMQVLKTNWQHDVVVIGSRAHLESDSIAQRNLFRTFLMHGFHFLVWLFAVRSVRDTQCGFKLFSRAAAKKLFNSLHVERWAFDVELLFLAERLKMPLEEVAVTWHEIEGSKLTPIWSWLQMGTDLFLIWLRYAIGYWTIEAQ